MQSSYSYIASYEVHIQNYHNEHTKIEHIKIEFGMLIVVIYELCTLPFAVCTLHNSIIVRLHGTKLTIVGIPDGRLLAH